MDNKSTNPIPKYFTLSDAIDVLSVKPELFFRALATLPALRHKRVFTIEDLASISEILKLEVIPKLIQTGEIGGARRLPR